MDRLANFLLLFLLTTVSALAQPYTYQRSYKADGTPVYKKESVPGSGRYDVVVSQLPSDATLARKASRSQVAYTPEAKMVMNPEQFGLNRYFSPTFIKCLDVNSYKSVTARRALGHNVFTNWSVKTNLSSVFGINQSFDYTDQLQVGEGKIYFTQNNLPSESPTYFFVVSLQQYVNDMWGRIPALGYGDLAKYRFFVLDFESATNGINPGQSGGPALPGFDTGYFNNWSSQKNQSIQLESSQETITLEQLANRGKGAWDIEMQTRRANRFAVTLEMAKKKANPAIDAKVSQGSCPVIGTDLSFQNSSGAFYDGYCKVQYIGGDVNGNITLTIPPATNWSVKLDGDCYSHSDFLHLYVYDGRPYFINGDTDESQIFDQKLSNTQSYPYLWSRIKTEHRTAYELALIEMNQQACLNRFGRKLPLIRMQEPFYEFFRSVPFSQLQNVDTYNNSNFLQTPRVWLPPQLLYTSAFVIRFIAGNEANWGYYLFPYDFQQQMVDPATFVGANGKKFYDHEMHNVTALYQAFADLQPYEQFFTGTTLTNPEVQLLQTGSWSAPYTAAEARNVNGGVHGVQKPVYRVRHKAVPGGTDVLIMGGMEQGWTDERTDMVRLPSGGLNGNSFRIKLRGPNPQVYRFFVPSTDSNQVFDALPVVETARERAGYAGLINN